MLNNINTRRDFFKNMLLAFVAIIPLSSFILKNSKTLKNHEFQTLSKDEANEIIKNEKFYSETNIKPKPAPINNVGFRI
ncbi:MAG: hypothetical protein A2046_17090 [Bacteroidetes bacterium GWA2_30_7]|nr:MAG: hypothetical protein A2046_17090 [Bacteroidetes bacterium GWA2_30_7]